MNVPKNLFEKEENRISNCHTSCFNNVNKIILQNDRNWTRNSPNTQNLHAFLDLNFLIIMAYYTVLYKLKVCSSTLLLSQMTEKLSNSNTQICKRSWNMIKRAPSLDVNDIKVKDADKYYDLSRKSIESPNSYIPQHNLPRITMLATDYMNTQTVQCKNKKQWVHITT